MSKIILILAANPKDTSRLRLDEEVREIENGLQRARKRDEFILKPILAARPLDVRRAMLDHKPSIVHFCGHGSGKSGIAFEDKSGNTKLVTADTLEKFFELFASTVECVVLNACYSEIQAEAIAKHINYVIGMKESIGDAAAVEFSVAFYDALGSGENFDFAYNLACNAIQWAGVPEHLTPILKSRTGDKNSELDFKPFDVFLSYSPDDISWATRLKSDLEQRGIHIWFGKDQVRPGDFFSDAIEKGLTNSRTFILIVSSKGVESGWVRDQYNLALSFSRKYDLHIIPLTIDNAMPPDYLSGRQCIDFSNHGYYEQAINRLIWPGITGKLVGIHFVVPEVKFHGECSCLGQLRRSNLFQIISDVMGVEPTLCPPLLPNRRDKDVRHVFIVDLLQSMICDECSSKFSPKDYTDFIFSVREATRGTDDEIVFVLLNKDSVLDRSCALDTDTLKRLEHYFSISSDKSSEELKNDVQILWGKIQRLLLSTERAFVAKTFVGISRASVSAIYPEVKHIRKMRVDFSSNCFIETDLISVYFENDDLIFSFKGIPVSLVTNRIGDRFFEVKIDNDRFILKPTGRKGIKLDTSRRIKRDVTSGTSGILGSGVIFRLEFE
jgi:hypothetical protein